MQIKKLLLGMSLTPLELKTFLNSLAPEGVRELSNFGEVRKSKGVRNIIKSLGNVCVH